MGHSPPGTDPAAVDMPNATDPGKSKWKSNLMGLTDM
jgi:hypothetical protein